VFIKAVFCGEGAKLKRIQPWSKGQARRITKRLSHLTLVLESKEDAKETVKENIEKDIDNKESK
jgi:ribosomal protein L22